MFVFLPLQRSWHFYNDTYIIYDVITPKFNIYQEIYHHMFEYACKPQKWDVNALDMQTNMGGSHFLFVRVISMWYCLSSSFLSFIWTSIDLQWLVAFYEAFIIHLWRPQTTISTLHQIHHLPKTTASIFLGATADFLVIQNAHKLKTSCFMLACIDCKMLHCRSTVEWLYWENFIPHFVSWAK